MEFVNKNLITLIQIKYKNLQRVVRVNYNSVSEIQKSVHAAFGVQTSNFFTQNGSRIEENDLVDFISQYKVDSNFVLVIEGTE